MILPARRRERRNTTFNPPRPQRDNARPACMQLQEPPHVEAQPRIPTERLHVDTATDDPPASPTTPATSEQDFPPARPQSPTPGPSPAPGRDRPRPPAHQPAPPTRRSPAPPTPAVPTPGCPQRPAPNHKGGAPEIAEGRERLASLRACFARFAIEPVPTSADLIHTQATRPLRHPAARWVVDRQPSYPAARVFRNRWTRAISSEREPIDFTGLRPNRSRGLPPEPPEDDCHRDLRRTGLVGPPLSTAPEVIRQIRLNPEPWQRPAGCRGPKFTPVR